MNFINIVYVVSFGEYLGSKSEGLCKGNEDVYFSKLILGVYRVVIDSFCLFYVGIYMLICFLVNL